MLTVCSRREMRKYRIGIAVLTVAVFSLSLRTAHGQSESAHSSAPLQPSTYNDQVSPSETTSPATQKVTAYRLPPDVYKKAHDRSAIRFRIQATSVYLHCHGSS